MATRLGEAVNWIANRKILQFRQDDSSKVCGKSEDEGEDCSKF